MFGQNIKLDWVILDKDNADLLNSFSCGNDGIDEYITVKGYSDLMAVTKMILNSENNEVICVYSLCCSSFIMGCSNGKYHPYPAVEIKIFAVNKKYQNMRYSDDPNEACLSNFILNRIIGEIFDFTDNVCGANIILLYSTDEGYSFYKKNGFNDFVELAIPSSDKFVDGCHPMFMAIR
ncbi:MAG: hypothetical protein K2G04_09710 [Oscillospiraceae bacterium]|nr:hypothetical protein [Oscillospiraceae bacterium]